MTPPLRSLTHHSTTHNWTCLRATIQSGPCQVNVGGASSSIAEASTSSLPASLSALGGQLLATPRRSRPSPPTAASLEQADRARQGQLRLVPVLSASHGRGSRPWMSALTLVAAASPSEADMAARWPGRAVPDPEQTCAQPARAICTRSPHIPRCGAPYLCDRVHREAGSRTGEMPTTIGQSGCKISSENT
jgi:hypothetical protein